MSLELEKKAARERAMHAVGAMTDSERSAASARIVELVLGSVLWRDSAVVLAFAGVLAEEPIVDGLVAARDGRTVCMPRIGWTDKTMEPASVSDVAHDLELCRYGIRVPVNTCAAVPPGMVGLVLVPGIGFDGHGGRLGRGGGFYDRWLGAHPGVRTLGVCFAAQAMERVPTGAHDRRVDGLVTEAGLEMFG